MKLVIPATLGLLALPGDKLQTDYTKSRTVRVETYVSLEMETTDMSILRDGEPVEGRGGGGGGGSLTTQRVVHVDRVLEHEDGTPTKVRRYFEEVEGLTTMSFGEEEREIESESSFDGLTLLLTDDDGEITVEVVDGSEPDIEGVLDGHHLALSVDALLGGREVEEGAEWDLDPKDLRHALDIDVLGKVFARAPREDAGGEGRRGGGRGGRGGRGGGGRGAGMLAIAELSGKATVGSLAEEQGGETCVRIDLEFGATGEMPEFGGGRGGGRGGRGGGGGGALMAPTVLPENTYEIELEGALYFSVKSGRPVLFEVEGTISTSRYMEREGRDGSTMTISSAQEGTFMQKVEYTEEAVEEEESK